MDIDNDGCCELVVTYGKTGEQAVSNVYFGNEVDSCSFGNTIDLSDYLKVKINGDGKINYPIIPI